MSRWYQPTPGETSPGESAARAIREFMGRNALTPRTLESDWLYRKGFHYNYGFIARWLANPALYALELELFVVLLHAVERDEVEIKRPGAVAAALGVARKALDDLASATGEIEPDDKKVT